MTYTITNTDGDILEKDITEDQVIDFCNDEFAETDNIETAIEEDSLYFDNIHDLTHCACASLPRYRSL